MIPTADGISPPPPTAWIALATIRNQIDVASPSTHLDGYFVTDGYGVFRTGGRLGVGIVQVNERKAPSTAQREWLNR